MPDKKLQPIYGELEPTEQPFHTYCGNEYITLGPGRTLNALSQVLNKQLENGEISVSPSVAQLRIWSKKYHWDSRCVEYDIAITEYQQTQAALVFQHKLVRAWGRVEMLINLAELLEEELIQKLWIPTSKAKATDKAGSLKLNAPLLSQLRGVLNDIALETGGRQRGSAFIEKNETKEPEEIVNLSELSDDEVNKLSDLINKALD